MTVVELPAKAIEGIEDIQGAASLTFCLVDMLGDVYIVMWRNCRKEKRDLGEGKDGEK